MTLGKKRPYKKKSVDKKPKIDKITINRIRGKSIFKLILKTVLEIDESQRCLMRQQYPLERLLWFVILPAIWNRKSIKRRVKFWKTVLFCLSPTQSGQTCLLIQATLNSFRRMMLVSWKLNSVDTWVNSAQKVSDEILSRGLAMILSRKTSVISRIWEELTSENIWNLGTWLKLTSSIKIWSNFMDNRLAMDQEQLLKSEIFLSCASFKSITCLRRL